MSSGKRKAYLERQAKVAERAARSANDQGEVHALVHVQHPKFGKGRLIADCGSTIRVAFDSPHGEKIIPMDSATRALMNDALRKATASKTNGVSPSTQRIIDDIKARATPRVIDPTPYRCEDEASIPARDWLYGHVLLRGCVSLVIAPGGVGKSSLVIVEAVAMASGRKLLHDQPYGRSRVWLWNGEEDRGELRRRVAAVRRHHRVTEEDLGDRLYIDSGLDESKEIVIAHMDKRDSAIIAKPMKDALIAAIRNRGIDVLIIDPFVSCHEVPENNNNAIDKVAKTYMKIAKETGCAIVLVHHTRKNFGRAVDIEDARGAGSLKDAVRAARALNVMTEDEAANAGVENRFLHVCIADGKANYAPRAGKATWLRLASVVLANGDDVGVPELWQWPDAFAGMTTAHLLAAQRAVDGGKWRENPQAKDWVGIPIAKALGRDLALPAERKALRTMIRLWIANGAFVVVTGKDANREERSYVEVGTWATD